MQISLKANLMMLNELSLFHPHLLLVNIFWNLSQMQINLVIFVPLPLVHLPLSMMSICKLHQFPTICLSLNLFITFPLLWQAVCSKKNTLSSDIEMLINSSKNTPFCQICHTLWQYYDHKK